jgi:CheY-like chemotaxis protein
MVTARTVRDDRTGVQEVDRAHRRRGGVVPFVDTPAGYPGNVLVLVVEDDAAVRALLVAVVGDMGLRVAAVHDGRAALDLFARERPALVLTDLMMPVLDGFAVCRALKADAGTRAVPVVAVSAGRNRPEALACGCDDFVAKPFDIDAVEATVRHWLQSA